MFDFRRFSSAVSAVALFTMLTGTVGAASPSFGRPTPPKPLFDDAQCMGVVVPAQVKPGQNFSASVLMRNTGTKIWTVSAPYSLASWVDPVFPIKNPLPRPQVPPFMIVSFSVPVTAPQTPGTYTFQAQMRNVGTAFGKTCSKKFIVVAPPSITVLSPNGGEIWKVGSKQTITWKSSNVPAKQVYMSLSKGQNVVLGQYVKNDGSEVITVPNNVGTGNDFTLTVLYKTSDAVVYSDTSDQPFSITATMACSDLSLQGANNNFACVNNGCYYDELNATADGTGLTCVAERLPCLDTVDQADDPSVKGTIWAYQHDALSGRGRLANYDYCKNDTLLQQVSCGADQFVAEQKTVCPNGCSDGVCIPAQNNAKLFVTVKALATSDTAVANAKNKTLLRFEALAQNGNVNLTSVTTTLTDALNGTNYTLWVDTDGDKVVDTILKSGVSGVATDSRVTFDNLPAGGYIVGTAEPTVFEAHADIASSFARSNELEMELASTPGYIQAENAANGASLSGIETNGVCTEPRCDIVVTPSSSTLFHLYSQGNLFVSKDSMPIRNHQLLGGTLAEPILSIKLRSEHEPIDVTGLQFTTMGGNALSVDRLELFKQGSLTPFAVATTGACGSSPVPSGGVTFCATMQSQQLVVGDSGIDKVLVRPRMKDDISGAVSGDAVQLFLSSLAVSDNVTGQGAVHARGVESSNNLPANNGDLSADGEIFIARNDASLVNTDIVGNPNVTVLSKIADIFNGGPATGSVPSGVDQTIGSFKISSLSNTNFKNGINKVNLATVLFNVNATNVEMSTAGFKGINKADSSAQFVLCYAYDANGNAIASPTVTGSFFVSCAFSGSPVNNVIDPGADATFGLLADVTNPNTAASTGGSSILQVSLQNFSDASKTTFGVSGSHFTWHDADSGSDMGFFWVDYPDTQVNSTTFHG